MHNSQKATLVTIKIFPEDGLLHSKNLLWTHLYDCLKNDQDIEVNLYPEGPCATSTGLYEILEAFCNSTGYSPSRIRILTGNMTESHPEFQIVKQPKYLHEIPVIQKWIAEHPQPMDNNLQYHFGLFIGRSRWSRLWIAAEVAKHADRSLMTFHSYIGCNYRTSKQEQVYDWLGLDDLVKYDCDCVSQAVSFLETCPRTLDQIELPTYIDQPNIYPIQVPENLNIIPFYRSLFADIVCETFVLGNTFFPTEKTWRPIVARRPFIVMGPADFLHNLHQLGFKTFWDFWDESYDGVSNQDRVRAIVKLIDTIAQWDINECKEKLNAMTHILEHNYARMLTLTQDEFNTVFNIK